METWFPASCSAIGSRLTLGRIAGDVHHRLDCLVKSTYMIHYTAYIRKRRESASAFPHSSRFDPLKPW